MTERAPTTRFPRLSDPALAAALSEEPVLLNGMKVVFDREVALTPVRLERTERGADAKPEASAP